MKKFSQILKNPLNLTNQDRLDSLVSTDLETGFKRITCSLGLNTSDCKCSDRLSLKQIFY